MTDTDTFVCLLSDNPQNVYGPFTDIEAFDFCAYWNTFFFARNLPGEWVGRLVTPAKVPAYNP